MGYTQSQIRWSRTKLKKCHIDIYVKTKNWSYARSEVLNQVQHLFQALNPLLRSFTKSSSLYFQSLTTLRLLMMLIFSEIKWNRSFRSKATWDKSFLMLQDYRKKNIRSQHKTLRRAVTTNVCGRKSSSELFPLATTHAKVANSGNSEVRQLATLCVIFFKKERRYSYRSWKNSSLQ